MATDAKSQLLAKHKWKDRVLILLSSHERTTGVDHQLAELRSDLEGILERKIVVYQAYPTTYKIGLENPTAILSGKIYNEFKKSDDQFEVILIGLDGSLKLRETSLVTIKTLFTLIDSMPMRKNEIKTKNKRL